MCLYMLDNVFVHLFVREVTWSMAHTMPLFLCMGWLRNSSNNIYDMRDNAHGIEQFKKYYR